ncbi:unnamed protein product [Pleuronectes platessa]|uniref:Uncharacterized protein n=1 Tax=Pleuronectes platessa TaxID=8262 RepID=A0A9N7TND3_PLEPL|nr:unnamed protein product [Pleuronectes platessa]
MKERQSRSKPQMKDRGQQQGGQGPHLSSGVHPSIHHLLLIQGRVTCGQVKSTHPSLPSDVSQLLLKDPELLLMAVVQMQLDLGTGLRLVLPPVTGCQGSCRLDGGQVNPPHRLRLSAPGFITQQMLICSCSRSRSFVEQLKGKGEREVKYR